MSQVGFRKAQYMYMYMYRTVATLINDLQKQNKSLCKMFADTNDDTKFIGKIGPSHFKEDQAVIHDNINKISEWCDKWLMYLSTEKCKIMRVDKRTSVIRYTINDSSTRVPHQLEMTDVERGLGIMISHDHESKPPRSQGHEAASKANRALDLPKTTLYPKIPFYGKNSTNLCKIIFGVRI